MLERIHLLRLAVPHRIHCLVPENDGAASYDVTSARSNEQAHANFSQKRRRILYQHSTQGQKRQARVVFIHGECFLDPFRTDESAVGKFLMASDAAIPKQYRPQVEFEAYLDSSALSFGWRPWEDIIIV